MAVKKTTNKKPLGRPSKYSVELAEQICDLVARGLSLRTICVKSDMPSTSTVCKWLTEHSEFSEQYARAREEQADVYADEIVEIADAVEPDSAAVSKAKLQIDARKWKAAKLAPKKYGDKVEQQISGALAVNVDVPLADLFLKDHD